MDGLEIHNFVLGQLQTNCYLICNKITKNAIIIDAPDEIEIVKDYISKNNFNVLFVLITHAHFDHIAGLENIDYKFYIHKEDYQLLKNHLLNGSDFFGKSISIKREPIFYKDNVEFDKFIIEILHTPGHTPGSVCLRLNNWLFSGDTIFFDSIGRTDIPLASEKTLLKSIKEKLLTLPDDTLIYPGHGVFTTLKRERENNPFILS